jgi:cytochrome c oxidase cbb3-type subunit 2
MKANPRIVLLLFAGACLAAATVMLVPGDELLGRVAPRRESPSDGLGKSVYDASCASCHGLDGAGKGIASGWLHPRPRDLTAGKFKFRSTESGSIPTDDDLMKSIREGLHGTSMPALKSFIGGDTLKALVEYVKSFSPRFATETPKSVPVGLMVPLSQGTIAAGKRAYGRLQCGLCHGSDGRGTGATTTTFTDEWGYDVVATDLTEPWTFRGGSTIRDIYLRFRTGIDGTPMPSFSGTAPDVDLWNLAQYVASMARKPVWNMNEREVQEFYGELEARAAADPVSRGKYLVSTFGCNDCHSPVRDGGAMIEEYSLAGGQRWELPPFGTTYSPNLTSDKETGLADKTDQQIVDALTKGIRTDGTRMMPFPMPWPSFAGLKESDVNAIVAYLRTIPPVYNKVPTFERPNIFSYLWGKFRMLILKEEMPALIHYGNVGAGKPTSMNHAGEATGKESVR